MPTRSRAALELGVKNLMSLPTLFTLVQNGGRIPCLAPLSQIDFRKTQAGDLLGTRVLAFSQAADPLLVNRLLCSPFLSLQTLLSFLSLWFFHVDISTSELQAILRLLKEQNNGKR